MSQENVEVFLMANDAYNAGDIDTMLNFYAADIEAIPDSSVFPEAEQLHGLGAFRAWLHEIAKAWDSVRWEIKEARAAGPDRVLVRGDWGGTGHGSGVSIASNFSGVFTVRDGRITRVEFFRDHDEALAAAGLEE
jgi:ketosteroid isomerase-like protein